MQYRFRMRIAASLFIIFIFAIHSLQAQEYVLLRTPLEQGFLQNGQRVGTWQYYDYPGNLGFEIDYESMQLLYVRPDSTEYVVKVGDSWVKERLQRPCRLHGSELLLKDHFLSTLTTPIEVMDRAKRKGVNLETLLTFEVGPDGMATNPIVEGFKGFSMEKMMMKSFSSAPSVWIPGLRKDGTPAHCKFGVSISICPDSCRQTIPDSYRTLFHTPYRNPYVSNKGELEPWTNEPTWIQFSPDNKWVLIESRLIANTGKSGFMVIPTADNPNGESRHISYGIVKSGYWLDDHIINFKYKYGIARSFHGSYDLAKDSIGTRKDSFTFFDNISPDRTTLCVATQHEKFTQVSVVDLRTGVRKILNADPSINPFPISWSPDQKSIILKGRKDNLDLLLNYDFDKGMAQQLPVLNSEPCGWDANGSILYVRRTDFPFYRYAGEVFSIDLKTMLVKELSGKIDGLMFALYSSSANQFLVVKNEKLHLSEPGEGFKLRKIADNVTAAQWSEDGNYIAYVSEKGSLLSQYNRRTGRTIILKNQFPSK